jgi:hypothetical protein
LLIAAHQIDWIATLTGPMSLFAPEPDDQPAALLLSFVAGASNFLMVRRVRNYHVISLCIPDDKETSIKKIPLIFHNYPSRLACSRIVFSILLVAQHGS